MADDPNRDILPVKEGSCADTCRSSIDPRERHFVCKLDRYQLEDRYLRLLEEASNLKKLSNCQEDKIKRLATKLMRASTNTRTCPVALDVHDDKNKITALELENSKLKDRISALRSQLLSHTMTGRSSSRSRNPQARPSSGRITCRSENSRTKIPSCHCIIETGNDDNDTQNYLVKIEELETERKEMSCRIAELEKELSASTASSQREKVAENVEYIRVWRQMKQLNDKLIAARSTNESLNVQINDLKRILEETTKNNQEIMAALVAEKKRMAEIDEQMLKAKDSQLTLREKDEQIRDLINEMKILQQHNSELIALSSKYGQVELENVELKKKVTEQLQDQQSLKTAFSTEQANIIALQAANEQLLGKLQELQKNIDSLTVQLMSFQTQTEKHESPRAALLSPKPDSKTVSIAIDQPELYKESSNQVEKCRKCCETYEKILQLEEAMNTAREGSRLMDKSIQTEDIPQVATVNKKNQGTSVMSPVKEKFNEESQRTDEVEQRTLTENALTPEKMLKLLEEAQINTSLDAARFSHKDGTNVADYGDILDLNQRHSDEEIHHQNPEDNPAAPRNCPTKINKASQNSNQSSNSKKLISILLQILQDHSSPAQPTDLYRPLSSDKDQFIKDLNNNIDLQKTQLARKSVDLKKPAFPKRRFTTSFANVDDKELNPGKNISQKGCSVKNPCSNLSHKLQQNKVIKRGVDDEAKDRNHFVRFTESNDCTCNDSMRCYANSDGGYQCCKNCSVQTVTVAAASNTNLEFGKRSMAIQNSLEVNNSIQESGNTVYVTRTVQGEGSGGPYRPREKKVLKDDQQLQDYVKELEKCREVLALNCTFSNIAEDVKRNFDELKISEGSRHEYTNKNSTGSSCSVNCPSDCIEAASTVSDSFPLLIADDQGLLEIHILSLQLSTSTRQILFQEDLSNLSLFINWNIWDQETACTRTMKCPTLNFNSSFVYRIPDLFTFFSYVLSEYVIFQAIVSKEDSYVAARAKLSIKDILDYPQNKLHYITPVNSIIPCTLGMNFGQLSLWVRLSCDVEKVDAFKKKCGLYSQREHVDFIPLTEKDLLKDKPADKTEESPVDLLAVKEQNSQESCVHEAWKNLINSVNPSIRAESSMMSDDTFESIVGPPPGHNALAAIVEEGVEKEESDSQISSRGLKARRSSSTIEGIDNGDVTSTEDNDRNVMKDRLSRESSMKKDNEEGKTDAPLEISSTMEFNTFIASSKNDGVFERDSNSTIHDVTEVFSDHNWEEYKQRSLLNFSKTLRTKNQNSGLNNENETTSNRPIEKDTIIIEIVNIILFQTSSVMQDDEVKLIYVEYSFLGHRGADMETISVEKPKEPNQKMTYNFLKKFSIEGEEREVERNTLRAMLNESINPNIKFNVVSEPLPEETDIKECAEVGFANFNIREYALGDSEKSISLPIIGTDQNKQVGVLKC